MNFLKFRLFVCFILLNTTFVQSTFCDLSDEELDEVAIEFCKNNEDVFIATIYPKAVGKDKEIIAMLSKCGPVLHQKNIHLKNEGPLYFLKHAYVIKHAFRTPECTGKWDPDFPQIREVLSSRFPDGDGVVRMYLFACDNRDKVQKIKKQIRRMFRARGAIHSTDDQLEALDLARVIFNKNSIDFLNNKKHIKCERFQHHITRYKQWIKDNNINPENVCLTGNVVLAAYGLQDCEDFTVLHYGHDSLFASLKKSFIKSENANIDQYKLSIEDIIFKPENYFYHDGVKFAALHVLNNNKLPSEFQHDASM